MLSDKAEVIASGHAIARRLAKELKRAGVQCNPVKAIRNFGIAYTAGVSTNRSGSVLGGREAKTGC